MDILWKYDICFNWSEKSKTIKYVERKKVQSDLKVII